MEEKPRNFEEFKKVTKDKRKEELKEQMNSLRSELKELRNSVFNEDDTYAHLTNDDEYEVLLSEGDFTKNDFELKHNRLYPSYQEVEKLRQIRREQERKNPTEFKKNYASRVYIKEFQERPEIVRLQIESMKKGTPNVPVLPTIPTDLPITRRDLEKFIGENLMSKIAALIILITLIVAYRYAIALGYVPRFARIAIGSLIGVGLFGTAHYLLSRKNVISTSLVLIGAAVLYYTAYLAYFDYEMINQPTAFVLNVVITVLITTAALLYDRMRLAIISIFGGYATPFVVSQGDGNYIFFFSYIFVINLAMVIIAYKKNWREINLISYIATLMFLFGWAIMVQGKAGPAEYMWLMVFSTLFYFVYFVNDIVYNIKPHITFITFDAYIMMSYTFFYVLGMWFITDGLTLTSDFKYFLAALGLFNLFYTFMIYRRDNVDDELEEIVLGKAVVFITIGGWLIFKESYINTFWVVESILLLISGLWLQNKLLKGASVLTLLLAIITMGIDWFHAYYVEVDRVPLIINEGFGAGLLTSFMIAATLLILYFKKGEYDIMFIPKESYAQTLGSILIFTTYFCGLLELIFHTRDTVGGMDFRVLVLGAYNMVYILGVRAVVMGFDIDRLKLFTGTMMGLAVVSYLVYGHFNTIALRDAFIVHNKPFLPFGFHYLNVVLSVLLVYLLIRDIVKSEGYASGKYSIVMWIMSVMIVTHATFELEHTVVLLRSGIFDSSIESSLDQIRLTGYSILWAVIGFAFMYIGMRNKIKEIRLISLVLLGLTLVKFFLFDFWKLEPIWKILVTFVIGILLLIVSNMYKHLQRLVSKGEFVLDKDQTLSQDDAYNMMKYMHSDDEDDDS